MAVAALRSRSLSRCARLIRHAARSGDEMDASRRASAHRALRQDTGTGNDIDDERKERGIQRKRWYTSLLTTSVKQA